jgi:hypothetical protein
MWRCVDLVWIDVSEERITSIFRVDKSASEATAWGFNGPGAGMDTKREKSHISFEKWIPNCGSSSQQRTVTCMWRDYTRVSNWILNLLTTYTHASELQAITAPPLIFTIHKSPKPTLSFPQPAVSSSSFPWQRLLTAEVLQLHALRSFLHSHPCRTQLKPLFQLSWL